MPEQYRHGSVHHPKHSEGERGQWNGGQALREARDHPPRPSSEDRPAECGCEVPPIGGVQDASDPVIQIAHVEHEAHRPADGGAERDAGGAEPAKQQEGGEAGKHEA